MNTLTIGLNGFGRIGRAFARIVLSDNRFKIAAINTRKSTPDILSYLLEHDSVYRRFGKSVTAKADGILVGGQSISTYNYSDPSEIPWDKHHVDIVVDCTGAFKKRDELKKHLRGSVKKVILTAPTSDDSIPHVVLGANDEKVDLKAADIISNASCTTNCAAIMTRVLEDFFQIKVGYLTTIHAYTSTQELLDDASKNETRSRAAALSIIPTTTGAAHAVCKTTTCELDRLGAIALRVPVPVGSISDMSVLLEKQTTVEEINETFKKESEGRLKGILGYEKTPLVSADYIGNPHSCTFDPNYTQVLQGNFIKIFGWYDNEWGYSQRLVDLIEKLSTGE